MFYFQYELLANQRKAEIERIAKEAWKLSSTKESAKTTTTLMNIRSSKNLSSQQQNCCVTC